ncbi:IclR family transcriptional regulator [Nocardioides stalactiti]|uniref:IclR family transcriptional regulator n=1 Tax=Nocardioides stalactiti TaxID=2755356 RepID=UPI0016003DFF|nr:helix-turn-helix domain-containing protein [Nocardioides stalactiti]
MSASPPTARALDVLELLGRPGAGDLRFSDIARELDLTQATGHAILTTLEERGWVVRDPLEKTYALGPGLAVLAGRAETARPLVVAARARARELQVAHGCPASVIERVAGSVVVTAFETGSPGVTLPVGDHLPYAAPLGTAFAAWESPAEQQAWRERSGVTDPGLIARLDAHLATVRERGYEYDHMTPAMAPLVGLVGTLRGEGVSPAIQSVVQALLGQIVAEQIDGPHRDHEVSTVSAPVFGPDGRVALLLSVHPGKRMTQRQVATLAREVTTATADLQPSTGEGAR